ncbi:MAG TPA: peptidoglycan DD-metalloendopeptidase family protein [Flavobacteriaceae bacterium]|nr:peptidoglycan DD-metalloendopeptidase family protein [Flavobacteriaceae bacterium]
MKNFKAIYPFLLIIFFLGKIPGYAQISSRAELEQRRIDLKKEITRINSLLINTKKEEKSVLEQVSDLNKRIKTTENLIAVINREANLLTAEINSNQKKIAKLLKELEKLKKDYAAMIVKSQRSSSQQNRLMFLFSSESFLQAYKRLQYMKQYANYRKEQGLRIKDQTAVLQVLNKKLIGQKKEKEILLIEKRKVREELQQDKVEQQALIAQIKENEGKYTSQIKQKQQEINKIDQQIDKMIAEAIAKENEEKGSPERRTFELTPAAKALAADFASNKGKLPWPVESGIVSMSFGKHPHPIVGSVTINSNGVRINTEENAKANAVFSGIVSEVQAVRGAHMAVMLRHGDYITIYNNLSDVYVKKGDQVSLGQALGKVAKSTATGKTTLYFLIYKNTQKLDPAAWIYKM